MREKLMRAGAIVFFALGAILIARPIYASGQLCYTPGGYHANPVGNGCISTFAPCASGATCGVDYTLKGSYCATASGFVSCTSWTSTTKIMREWGQCANQTQGPGQGNCWCFMPGPSAQYEVGTTTMGYCRND